MKNISIGIIGNGYVGDAINFAFSKVISTKIYDVDPNRSSHSLHEVNSCDFVFICVPTPMFEDGKQDLSYVSNVFESATKHPIYILKSTVLPGTTKTLSNKYPDFKIIFSPEFLTEKNAKKDISKPDRIILGGENKFIKQAEKLFNYRFKHTQIILTDSTTSELIKYMNNSFLATKVSILNEFKLLCDVIGADWQDALNGFSSDKRVGKSHLNVPGHDGKFGYGGSCFPKDVNAIINFAKSNGIELNTIIGGWNTNLNVRPERDWEKIGKRAFSSNNS